MLAAGSARDEDSDSEDSLDLQRCKLQSISQSIKMQLYSVIILQHVAVESGRSVAHCLMILAVNYYCAMFSGTHLCCGKLSVCLSGNITITAL